MRDIDSHTTSSDDPLLAASVELSLTGESKKKQPKPKVAKSGRKHLSRNRDFAERCEMFFDFKERDELIKREMDSLGLKEEMLSQYPESKTIPVFKSPQGLMAQLIVAHRFISDEETLRRVLGLEFKYPLVRRVITHQIDGAILERRIRQGRLPGNIRGLVTKTQVTFNVYTPLPDRSSRRKKK